MSSKQIIIIPDGGLANRIRAITSGVALAKSIGKQPVVLWHRDKGLNASFQAIFNSENLLFDLKEIGSLKFNLIYEIPRKRNFYISKVSSLIDRRIRIYQDFNKEIQGDEEVKFLASMPNKTTIIYSGADFYPFDSNFLNEVIKFSPIVHERSKEILKGESPSIGIQIRRTDNFRSIYYSPLSSFEEVVKNLIKKDNDVKIFLATDDDETKKYFLINYSSNIVFNPKKANRNSQDGIIDAASEMNILSQCEIIYGSFWSSFSEIASKFGNNKLNVIRI